MGTAGTLLPRPFPRKPKLEGLAQAVAGRAPGADAARGMARGAGYLGSANAT